MEDCDRSIAAVRLKSKSLRASTRGRERSIWRDGTSQPGDDSASTASLASLASRVPRKGRAADRGLYRGSRDPPGLGRIYPQKPDDVDSGSFVSDGASAFMLRRGGHRGAAAAADSAQTDSKPRRSSSRAQSRSLSNFVLLFMMATIYVFFQTVGTHTSDYRRAEMDMMRAREAYATRPQNLHSDPKYGRGSTSFLGTYGAIDSFDTFAEGGRRPVSTVEKKGVGGSSTTQRRREEVDETHQLQSVVKVQREPNKIGDYVNCPVVPTVHDRDAKYVQQYQETIQSFIEENKKESIKYYDLGALIKEGQNPQSHRKETLLAVPRVETLNVGAKLFFHKLPREETAKGLSCASAWNDTYTVEHLLPNLDKSTGWVPPPPEAKEEKIKIQIVRGEYVAYLSYFTGFHYGHFLHDHLPLIAWVKESFPFRYKLLLPFHPRDKSVLEVLDKEFVRERVVWVLPGVETIQIGEDSNGSGSLSVLVSDIPERNTQILLSLRRWILQSLGNEGADEVTNHIADNEDKEGEEMQDVVIYYRRKHSKDQARNGRVVDTQHEDDILAMIEDAMGRHGLQQDTRLVVFDGQENGKVMTVQRQIELFKNAKALIGPHGAGLSNLIWMMGQRENDNRLSAASTECSEGPRLERRRRPQVLEFLIGPHSTQVQPGSGPFLRSLYYLFPTTPWVDFHHVLYAPNSTSDKTFVDLRSMRDALDAMWDLRSPQIGNSNNGEREP